MKLSISQMAWNQTDNIKVLAYLKTQNFQGIEVLPTMVVKDNPYGSLEEAVIFQQKLAREYSLEISSMQSLIYGRRENLFGTDEEREVLLNYLQKAILFANKINCPNLVFGSPKNRLIGKVTKEKEQKAYSFFKKLGDFAYEHKTFFSLEANPAIYGGDYLLTTKQALDVVKEVNSPGFCLNLDLGAVIENKESLDFLQKKIDLVNHIHISEPFLAKIKPRTLHQELAEILRKLNYEKYVSIEMKNLKNFETTKKVIEYIKEVFG
ncbi:MAG: sugar phosphate isomerase/epimerase [Streptococcaceae bacterium]|jgi:sugar phosphate isomerase/epimerase|nr:sugar phosphate isomerase/epimerase [Streptococcaceae bacterium]